MDLWVIMRDVVVLLGASLLVGGVFARFGQSPIVGYLLAGMMLGGPGSFDVVSSEEEIEAISELGVALLLFSLGLEFSLERLKNLGFKPLLGGVAQILMVIFLAFLSARLFGLGTKESVAVGAMIALSSTAVVLRILMERGELETPHGRNSLGVLLTQDMAVVPLALLMTLLGEGGSANGIAAEIGRLLFMASALVVGLFLLTRIAVFALGTLTLHRNRELTVIFAVVAGLGAAWAAHVVGISPALGAFVAGMLLGSSAFATQIRADVSPLRVILLTLFFGAAGMVADPIWILTNAHLVGLFVVALTLGKLLIIWGIFIAFGQTTRVSVATGLCLAQIGEFAFVLGNIGRSNEVVSEGVYSLVVSSAIVSFFLSAWLVPMAPRIANWIANLLHMKHVGEQRLLADPGAPDIVVIGFGPAGQIAAHPLIDKGLRVTVVDLNRESVKKSQEQGFVGQVGDATQFEVLEHIHLSECKAVVIAVPHHNSAMAILERVREDAPQAHIIARSRYAQHSHELEEAGAHFVAGDEEQVGERLASQVDEWLKSTGTGSIASEAVRSGFTQV